LAGVVLDPRGAVIVKAKITAKSVTGQEYKTATNEYGNYSLLLPVTNYGLGVLSSEDFEKQPLAKFELIVEANGFKKTVIKEFIVVPTVVSKMNLDIVLEVPDRSSYPCESE
jgi:hypothetical protein